MKLLQALRFRRRVADGAERKWKCGHALTGQPCRMGPDGLGRCRASFECAPTKIGDQWQCRRPASRGGPCPEGPTEDGTCCHAVPPCTPVRTLRAKRAAVSMWTAIIVFGACILALSYMGTGGVLMPGPLSVGHSTILDCKSCHTNVSEGRFAWLHSVIDRSSVRKDSEACISCHEVTPDALQPHGAALAELEALTKKFQATAASSAMPLAGRVRNAVLPTDTAFANGVACATCHKEHHGEQASLTDVASDNCHSCHALQFESFEHGHPEFSSYPFSRRTRINFDHNSHFGEHFPKTRAKNDPSLITPDTCAGCHTLSADGSNMNVEPFDTVCSSCHLHQITGSERLSGPQGVAFFALPGIDIDTLAEKNIAVGEWPAESEAVPTAFMLMLLDGEGSRGELIKLVNNLDLLDLSEASSGELKAVEWFVWEMKALLHALSTQKPGDALERLSTLTKGKPSAHLIAQLTANLPRDVLLGAIRDWLPNLEAEMAAHTPIDVAQAADASRSADAVFRSSVQQAAQALASDDADADPAADEDGEILDGEDDELEEGAQDDADEEEAILDGEDDLDLDEETDEETDEEEIVEDDGGDILDGEEDPETDEDVETAEDEPSTDTESLEAVDAQSWAELGGWYRQEYSIIYKPTGHADGFFKAWLDWSGALTTEVPEEPAQSVFAALSGKDARGQCIKCHAVERAADQTLSIDWGAAGPATKAGRFTKFLHEPHFGFPGEEGCLSCHKLEETSAYQKGFEDFDPSTFASNFKPVEHSQCAECHTEQTAGATCLTCHEYHVNDVTTPIMSTKVPEK